ncbi:cation:proton antiporter [Streptomyces sp. LX-29]|uniref:cation:proton antiporter n=1 Tax=Streptomyces sp. LX-29 TaxID=2900152 RepID=UPI00240D5961|nr:cation:proton antiporter [Streptomyces sp. LX-29]WFB09340.1 cation:proton antiporter [Streptomyces sp. LX-29]
MDSHLIVTLLLDLALIVVLARVFGAAARRLKQPAVIGEVFAGILVGPTLFDGWIADNLFPAEARPFLSALAQVGVAVFMFVVGLEVDRTLLRNRGRIAASVSLTSIALPFSLGLLLALYLVDRHQSPDDLGFVLFMGAAMSITAFPVLARILTDRGLHRTALGGLALACATIDDVLAWSLLAVVVTVIGADAEQWRILLVLPYVAAMVTVVPPLLRRLMARGKPGTGEEHARARVLAVALAGLLASAAATEWMGLHFIFGAFLFGAVIPRDSFEWAHRAVVEGLGQISTVLLLPVFFVVAGLKVDLSGLDAGRLGELALILLVAIGGKFCGAYLAARAHGVAQRQAAALGALMNTRGLTELIILSVGLQLGVLDQSLYSLMVVMAVVTTAMAGPLLQAIYPDRLVQRELDVLSRPSRRERREARAERAAR